MNNSMRNSTEYGTNPNSRLWKPLKIGNKTLKHRVGMCPLTRYRSPNGTPTAWVTEYYSQRASGGLIVTEASFIAPEAGGYPNAPGIYSKEQIAAWQKVTAEVHSKDGIIFSQFWALGRVNQKKDLEKAPLVYGPSTTPVHEDGYFVPQEMTKDDIKRYMGHYRHAAKSAMEAGFDGCEVHGAHGYLADQFLQASSNNTRTDEYGGSLENRARFMLEALQAVVDVVGEDRTAIRLSPFSAFQGMAQKTDDPFETWGYVCSEIKRRFPKFGYVSFTDPKLEIEAGGSPLSNRFSSDKFRAVFRNMDVSKISEYEAEATTIFPDPTPELPTFFYCAGGYSASDAEVCSERTGDVIAYGRLFIANPDLPHRLRHGLELNPYDRSTFYSSGMEGYIDYPVATLDTKRFVPPIQS